MMDEDLKLYEAKVTLEDGTTLYASVEAEDRQDAKYEFAHSPIVTIGDEQERVVKVDYRSVRLVHETET